MRVRESVSVHLQPLPPQPLVRAPTAPVQQAEGSEFREQTDAVNAARPCKPPPPPSTQPPSPESIARNAAAIARARTIIRNGPMGVLELGKVEAGTKCMMDEVALVQSEPAQHVQVPSCQERSATQSVALATPTLLGQPDPPKDAAWLPRRTTRRMASG